MSDEHDSWFKDAFGVDLGQAVQVIKDEASAVVDQVSSTVTQVVQGVQGAVEGALDEVTGAAAGLVKKVAGAVSPAGAGGASGASGAGGGTGSFPLGGSVGRGGKNAPNDVRAVQAALGISADGQCGGQTIAAIEAFQRNMGQAKPDGRVDAGGATERALAGGATPAVPPAAPDTSGAEDDGGLLGQVVAGAKGLLGGLGDAGQQISDAAQGVLDSGGAATADDLNAGGGSFAQGLADGIVRAMNEGRDLAFLLTRLKNLEMRELLEVMDHIKRAGKLPEFASRAAREPPRVRVAILTVLPSFDAEWRSHLGGLSEADRKAVLERTPKSVQESSGLAPKGGGGQDEDPGGSVEVDVAGVAVKGKIEFNSKAFGALGHGEVSVKLGADGKLHEVEVEVAKIKAKLEKLGKLGPILDLEASVSLKASAEIGEHDKKTVVEGVKAGVATEIGVSLKKVPGLKKVTLKFTAGAGTGGFEFGGAIEIPIPRNLSDQEQGMSDEHDSWFKDAFGVDLGQAVQGIKDEASAVVDQVSSTVTQVVQGVQGAVEGALDEVTGAAAGLVKKVAGAVLPGGAGGGGGAGGAGGASGAGGGTGSFPLGGSVGRGGKNAPNDVRAVQAALGISADGQCGGQTIAAIEAFQRNMGQARPDGRVDAGGATERAMAGGASGASAAGPAPSPAKEDDNSGSLLDQAVAGVKNLGGQIGKELEEDFGAAKAFVGNVFEGVEGGLSGGSLPLDTSGGGASNSLLGLIESYGGELTFAEKSLGKKPLGKYFEFEAKVSGSVKFSGSKAGLDKPSKIEVEKGVLEFVEGVFLEGIANFKTETGTGIKPNATKAGRGLSLGGAVAFKTNLGPLTLEFATIEVSLVNFDPKKGLSGPKLSAGTSRSLGFKRTIKGVELEGAIAVTLNGELTPDYVGIAADVARNAFAEGGTSAAISMAIDVALVAGPPLAAGAVIGIGIFMAGEKGKRDAAIIEGAVDARQAAFDYASTMTGSEGSGPGPRAKAVVAVAKSELGMVASSQKVSLEELMTELRRDRNNLSDFRRIHAQARQQIFAGYFGEVRSHLKKWREEHSVLAAFTTEADDFVAVEKLVAIQFQKS